MDASASLCSGRARPPVRPRPQGARLPPVPRSAAHRRAEPAMVAPAPIRTRLTRTRAETARSAGGSPRHLPGPCSWHPIPMAPRSRLPSGCPAPAAQRTMNGSVALLATISSARVCASWRRRPVPANPASPTCIWRRWRCCRRIDDAALATLWWQQGWRRHSHRAPARSPVPPRLRVSGAVTGSATRAERRGRPDHSSVKVSFSPPSSVATMLYRNASRVPSAVMITTLTTATTVP